MAKGDQANFVPLDVEFVDNSVINNPEAKFRTTRKPSMTVTGQIGADFPDPFFDAVLKPVRKVKKDRIELTRKHLRCQAHFRSTRRDRLSLRSARPRSMLAAKAGLSSN